MDILIGIVIGLIIGLFLGVIAFGLILKLAGIGDTFNDFGK